MVQNTYQEPIEKEDLNLKEKFGEAPVPEKLNTEKSPAKEQIPVLPETEKIGEARGKEGEAPAEAPKEKVDEKIETARKTIQTQAPPAKAGVATDAQAVSRIDEHEKKVKKLVELALQKGPEHAIRVARHMDKGKSAGERDNYTLDEIHDRLLEEDLRKQLIAKGLLKDL